MKSVLKKCSKCVLKTGSLLRKEVFCKYPSKKYCENIKYDSNSGNYSGCSDRYSRKHRSFCDNKCPKACEEWNYLFELKEKKLLPTSPWDMTSIVNIKRNQILDHFVEHLPEMSFIEFICGFGGLLGMWLGLSALAILHFILQFIEN